jgi:hypothetical protein
MAFARYETTGHTPATQPPVHRDGMFYTVLDRTS